MKPTCRSNRFMAWTLAAAFGGVVFPVGALAQAGGRGSSATPPATSATVIRVARSQDGITFTDTGEVLLQHAAAPDLEVLPNGDLLTIFDFAGSDGSWEPTVMAASRSRDEGRSWSRAGAIRMRVGGARGRTLHARHGDMIRDRSGRFRLFFFANVDRKNGHSRGRANGMGVVRSAVTLNGLDYYVDRRTLIRLPAMGEAHPMATRVGTRIHLFAAEGHADTDPEKARAEHFVSRDGRRFVHLRPSRTPEVNFLGSIVTVREGLRAYVSSEAGVRSLVSRDARDWVPESGLRLAGGWDPAVARLKDGSYLMLYCAPLDAEASATEQLVEVPFDAGRVDDAEMLADAEPLEDWYPLDELDDPANNASADAMPEVGSQVIVDPADAPDDHSVVVAILDPDGKEADGTSESATTPAGGEAEGGDLMDRLAESDAAQQEFLRGLLEPVEPETVVWADAEGYAPMPDFTKRVDYLEWYKQYALGQPEDNAYEHYMRFMPGLNDEPGSKPEWPDFNDMFNGDYEGPPVPWDPADRPDWEEAHQAVQDLLEQFRDASMHTGYANPPITSGDMLEGLPDSKDLLVGLMLPSLSPHRQMVRATLADAWRLENGKVSSERMLNAWETCLRAASHLNQGATLIEALVGTAERAQVQETARWALKHEVFRGDELRSAFETLRDYDQGNWDMTHATRGEHAMSMDFTQWMFSPPAPDGQPKLNPERAEALASWDWIDEHTVESYSGLGPDDAYATIEAFDGYYRQLTEQMRIGYPDVRAADIAASAEEYIHATPLTDMFLPNLSRAYHLHARLETSRRATQLAYATHVFKAENGRWPESLDELPAELGDEIRTDPFTGHDFGYRMTEEGPKIYTLSENAIDDDGVHSRRWNDEPDPETGSDDHVFWPPQSKP